MLTTIPYFVLPGGSFGRIGVGDIAIIHATINKEDRLVFAVVGNSGPTESFGEPSVALLQRLMKKQLEGVENNAALNSWHLPGKKVPDLEVTVLLLGGTASKLGGLYTEEKLKDVGLAELKAWNRNAPGDLDRLRACAAQTPVNN